MFFRVLPQKGLGRKIPSPVENIGKSSDKKALKAQNPRPSKNIVWGVNKSVYTMVSESETFPSPAMNHLTERSWVTFMSIASVYFWAFPTCHPTYQPTQRKIVKNEKEECERKNSCKLFMRYEQRNNLMYYQKYHQWWNFVPRVSNVKERNLNRNWVPPCASSIFNAVSKLN